MTSSFCVGCGIEAYKNVLLSTGETTASGPKGDPMLVMPSGLHESSSFDDCVWLSSNSCQGCCCGPRTTRSQYESTKPPTQFGWLCGHSSIDQDISVDTLRGGTWSCDIIISNVLDILLLSALAERRGDIPLVVL